MRETHFRATYRRLQWHTTVTSPLTDISSPSSTEHYPRSTRGESTASVVDSHTSCAESDVNSEDENEDGSDPQHTQSQSEKFAVEKFRQLNSENEEAPSLHKDATSNATPSLVSWSSRSSSNPFRKHMEEARVKSENFSIQYLGRSHVALA